MTSILQINDRARDFGKETLLFHHNLHESPLFSDAGLIALIDAYPKDQVEVFTMGEDVTKPDQWFFGRRGRHDGAALMQGVKEGRLWINLRKSNRVSPDIEALTQTLFAEVTEQTGVSCYKPDLGVLISSPNAQVFYHLDMPLVMLYQIRGEKKVYLYPADAPYFTDTSLESIALRENDETLPFDAKWDEAAYQHILKPGEMLSWTQNAPHRIVNQDCVNVSLSVEFMTAPGLWRANVIYGNGLLRRWFGLKPSLKTARWLDPLKVALSRVSKVLGGYKGMKSPLKPSFSLADDNPAKIVFD